MWKEVLGYNGCYEADENGNIRSKRREIVSVDGHRYTLNERILKPNITPHGYKVVHLCKNGKRRALYVHRIIAELFLDKECDTCVVNHIDGNKLNCAASNLEWVSYSENNLHAYATGLKPDGDGHYKSILTSSDVKRIRKHGKYDTYRNIGNLYGVSGATIRDVLLFNTWKQIK